MEFGDLVPLTAADICAGLDIAAVASVLGQPLSETRDRMRCPNPDHPDRNPSTTIFTGDDGKQRWKCHSCGERGDVVDLLRLVEGLTYAEAVTRGAELLEEGLPAPERVSADVTPADLLRILEEAEKRDAGPIESLLASWEAPYTLAWLRETFRVGVNDKGSVLIPHFAWGALEPCALKWRSGDGKGALEGSRLTSLYGEWHDRKRQTVMLCEGESDTWLATFLFGASADVLGLPSGVNARPLDAWIERLTGRDVVLAFDADNAGRIGMRRWVRALMPVAASVHLMLLPEGRDLRSAGLDAVRTSFLRRHRVPDISAWPLFAGDDRYWRRSSDEAKPAAPVSDFTLALRQRVEVDGEKIIWKVDLPGSREADLESSDLTDVRSLTRWANRYGHTWTGTARDVQELFRLLEVNAFMVPRFDGKRVAGWHDGAFVFPEPFGNIGHARYAFVRPDIDPHWEERMRLLDGGADPSAIRALLSLSEPAVMTTLLGWVCAAPLRALCVQFPSFAVMGSAGSGKTTLVSETLKTFGWTDGTPTTISATTAHAVWGLVGSTNAIPVWFDEYRPGAREDGIGALDQAIRDGWNGSATMRGGMGDNKSALVTLKTRSPIIVSGESAFTEQSHAERMAILTLDRRHRSVDALAALKASRRQGLGRLYLTWLVEQHEANLLPAPPAIDDRHEQTVAVCRWGYGLFVAFARQLFGIRELPAFQDSLVRAEYADMSSNPPILEALRTFYMLEDKAMGGFVVWSEREDVLVNIGRFPSVVARHSNITLPSTKAAAIRKWLIERFPGTHDDVTTTGGNVLRITNALAQILTRTA